MALRAAGRGLWRAPLQTRFPVLRGAWGQAAFLSSDNRFVDGGGAGGEPLRNDYLIACDRIDVKHGAKNAWHDRVQMWNSAAIRMKGDPARMRYAVRRLKDVLTDAGPSHSAELARAIAWAAYLDGQGGIADQNGALLGTIRNALALLDADEDDVGDTWTRRQALELIGACFERAGRTDEAVSVLQRVLHCGSPGTVPRALTLCRLGMLHAIRGQLDDGADLMKRGLRVGGLVDWQYSPAPDEWAPDSIGVRLASCFDPMRPAYHARGWLREYQQDLEVVLGRFADDSRAASIVLRLLWHHYLYTGDSCNALEAARQYCNLQEWASGYYVRSDDIDDMLVAACQHEPVEACTALARVAALGNRACTPTMTDMIASRIDGHAGP